MCDPVCNTPLSFFILSNCSIHIHSTAVWPYIRKLCNCSHALSPLLPQYPLNTEDYSEVLAAITALVNAHNKTLGPLPPAQLDSIGPTDKIAPCCNRATDCTCSQPPNGTYPLHNLFLNDLTSIWVSQAMYVVQKKLLLCSGDKLILYILNSKICTKWNCHVYIAIIYFLI